MTKADLAENPDRDIERCSQDDVDHNHDENAAVIAIQEALSAETQDEQIASKKQQESCRVISFFIPWQCKSSHVSDLLSHFFTEKAARLDQQNDDKHGKNEGIAQRR